MPRKCTVCKHKKRDEIDQALVNGEEYRNIAKRQKVSITALWRHKADHIPAALAKAKSADDATHAEDLLKRFDALLDDAQRIGSKAEAAKSYSAALAGVREMVRINELLLEVRGEINRGVQITLSTEWATMRTAIMNALAPFPEARQAVAGVLLDANPSQ